MQPAVVKRWNYVVGLESVPIPTMPSNFPTDIRFIANYPASMLPGIMAFQGLSNVDLNRY